MSKPDPLALLRARPLPPAPDRLRALREALGKSEATLAQELGVSGPAVHAWEVGDGRPAGANPHKIELWARAAARTLSLPDEVTIDPIEWLTVRERASIEELRARGEQADAHPPPSPRREQGEVSRA